MQRKIHALIIMTLSILVWGIYFLVTDVTLGNDPAVIVTDVFMEIFINIGVFYFVEFMLFTWRLYIKNTHKGKNKKNDE